MVSCSSPSQVKRRTQWPSSSAVQRAPSGPAVTPWGRVNMPSPQAPARVPSASKTMTGCWPRLKTQTRSCASTATSTTSRKLQPSGSRGQSCRSSKRWSPDPTLVVICQSPSQAMPVDLDENPLEEVAGADEPPRRHGRPVEELHVGLVEAVAVGHVEEEDVHAHQVRRGGSFLLHGLHHELHGVPRLLDDVPADDVQVEIDGPEAGQVEGCRRRGGWCCRRAPWRWAFRSRSLSWQVDLGALDNLWCREQPCTARRTGGS